MVTDFEQPLFDRFIRINVLARSKDTDAVVTDKKLSEKLKGVACESSSWSSMKQQIFLIITLAEGPIILDVSTENGNSDSRIQVLFASSILSLAAAFANPRNADEAVMSIRATVSEQVASHFRDLPCWNEKTVMSTVRQPSPRPSCIDSSMECTPTMSRACFMISPRTI